LNPKSKYAILLISSVLVIYAIIGGMLGRVSAQNGSYQQLSIFMEVLSRIQNDYVDDPSMKSAVDGAIRGLVENVDPYGGYLTAKDVAFYKNYDPLKTPGIGVVLAKPARLGYPVIVSAIPGGPAAKAGLNPGDIIESIDGVATREMNLVQVYGMLSNPVGKPAALAVIKTRRTDPDPVNVPREVVQGPPVEAKMLENNIAYIKIPYLGPGKASEVKKELEPLLKKGATNIVLDLRYTAGGDPKEGIQLANLFVDSGTITYLEGQKFAKETFNANPKDVVTKAPIAVLVNQATSGAAELVAGAVEDNHRGQVVGVKTFGSGSMQKLINLDDGSALLLSVAKYFTPSGKEIENIEPQESGIKPTVEMRQAAEDTVDLDDQEVQAPAKDQPVKEEDRQLNRAIEILKDPSKISATKKAA